MSKKIVVIIPDDWKRKIDLEVKKTGATSLGDFVREAIRRVLPGRLSPPKKPGEKQ